MNNKKIIALLSAMLAVFCSCQVELSDDSQMVTAGKVLEFTASRGESDATKSVLHESDRQIYWCPGDCINIFQGSLSSGMFTSTETESETLNTTFTGTLSAFFGATESGAAVNSYFWALDPYQEDASCDGSSITLTVDDNQQGYAGSYNPGSFPSIAKSSSNSLHFYNVCGGLAFTVKNRGIVSLTFRGNNHEILAGEVKVGFDSNDRPAVNEVVDGKDEITITAPSAAGFVPGTTYYLVTLPAALTEGYTISFSKRTDPDDESSAETVNGACADSTSGTFRRSVFAQIANIDANATFAPGHATDLSETESANTYIVSTPALYMFKAVKGNSSESVGTVVSAETVWESNGSSIATAAGSIVKDVQYFNDYIYFRATSLDGNAVIAAKDAQGNVLWTWHVWSTTSEPQDQTYYHGAGIFMDRNLGALSVNGALSNGLLYKSGSKDPYPQTDEATSVENPYTVIDGYAQSGTWTYSKTDRTAKSIYDPCPEGYRLPEGGVDGEWAAALGSTSSVDLDDASSAGYDFTAMLGNYSSVWYPVKNQVAYWWGAEGTFSVNLTSATAYPVYNGTAPAKASVRCVSVSSTPVQPVTSVALDSTALHMEVDASATLHFTVNPSNANVRDITWSTTDANVAVVENGEVTAVGAGQCDIVASAYNGVNAVCRVTVTRARYRNLSADGTANCYIVTKSGSYRFQTVKGNSTESVGNVASAAVVWESYGTSTAPAAKALVDSIRYDASGYITFYASNKKGNAVIAAKNASGTILWSWHIWMTDAPADQVYYHSAGTMMDRNLGATSTSRSELGSLGLLYQWGRKDPFIGGNSLTYSSTSDVAKAVATPALSSVARTTAIAASTNNNALAYSIAHPSEFIKGTADWYVASTSDRNDNLWASTKTIYDPCPPGYRVPDGGTAGFWPTAAGATSGTYTGFSTSTTYRGLQFSGTLGSDSNIWYPAAGYLVGSSFSLNYAGYHGNYWTCTPSGNYAYYATFDEYGRTYWAKSSNTRAHGQSVRCCRE